MFTTPIDCFGIEIPLFLSKHFELFTDVWYLYSNSFVLFCVSTSQSFDCKLEADSVSARVPALVIAVLLYLRFSNDSFVIATNHCSVNAAALLLRHASIYVVRSSVRLIISSWLFDLSYQALIRVESSQFQSPLFSACFLDYWRPFPIARNSTSPSQTHPHTVRSMWSYCSHRSFCLV